MVSTSPVDAAASARPAAEYFVILGTFANTPKFFAFNKTKSFQDSLIFIRLLIIPTICYFLFFDQGLLIEEGSPDHFFSNPKEDRTKLFLSQIL